MKSTISAGRPRRRALSAAARLPRGPAFVLAAIIGSVWCVCRPVEAAVYASESAFILALEPGAFTETFSGLTPETSLPSPLSFAGPSPGNPFAYSVVVEGGLFPIANPGNATEIWLSTQIATDIMTITNTGQSITGIGGHFFLTDFSGAVIPGTIRASLSDGSFYDLTDQLPTDFWGVTGTSPFTSLTLEYLGNPEADAWITVGSLSVGIAAVPEPATLSMVGLGMVGGLGLARRRSRRHAHREARERAPDDTDL
jgi:hypothetical protein